MKCNKGDIAKIIYSMNPSNVGRIVKVAEYIGKFQQGSQFAFRGVVCQALVSDHYWWIEAEDLDIQLGPSPRAYIADTWLEPIRPDKKSKEQEELELDLLGLSVL